MGSREDVAAKIDKDTEEYMKTMEQMVLKNKDAVSNVKRYKKTRYYFLSGMTY